MMVNPRTHDFDDIVDELNQGFSVVAEPGAYPGSSDVKTVTDGSLTFLNGARVVVPDDPPPEWIQIRGSVGTPTSITEDADAGDLILTVDDTSAFSNGQPALLNDDGGYATMDGRGECVYVSKILDDTRLIVRDEIGLSHSTSDSIELQPMDPLTERNSWDGVTFDCRGVTQNQWPLMTRHHVDSHVLWDITFMNGDGSSMHQYLEVRESYNPKLINSRSGRVNDGDLGLFWSPERQTRHAEMRHCTVYHGNVAEFGNGGTGPSQDATFRNVTCVGGGFSSNPTVIRPEYVDCTVSSSYKADTGFKVGFLSDGVDARYVNCSVTGSHTGFALRGRDETLVDCEVRDAVVAGIRFGADGDHPDANTGTKQITGMTAEGCPTAIASVGSPGQIDVADVAATDNDELLNLGGAPDRVAVDGGTLRGGNEIAPGATSRLELRNLDVDGAGSVSGDWLRESSSDEPDHVLVADCSFYDIDSGSVIRLENFGTLEVADCRAQRGQPPVDHYLVRDDGGGSQVILKGNDARNTGASNGYQLSSGEPISDGANLTNDGSAI